MSDLEDRMVLTEAIDVLACRLWRAGDRSDALMRARLAADRYRVRTRHPPASKFDAELLESRECVIDGELAKLSKDNKDHGAWNDIAEYLGKWIFAGELGRERLRDEASK